MENDFLWVEKYRPQSLKDCILPEATRKQFQAYIDQKNVPNLLLSGSAGTGKTTTAKAVLKDLDCDYMLINGSLDRNIGTLRNDIQSYAGTLSLSGGRKYVILDEADYLNPESTMPALRSFITEFSDNCGFILTCNWRNRIIEPLQSRLALVEFKIEKEDKQTILLAYLKRTFEILSAERVKFDKQSVTAFVLQHFPDLRKTLGELQKYASIGEIDNGILRQKSVDNFKELLDYIKNKEFNKVKVWVEDNKDIDFPTFTSKFFEAAQTNFAAKDIPQIVLILADYQFKDAFVADKSINMLAMLTEIMITRS